MGAPHARGSAFARSRSICLSSASRTRGILRFQREATHFSHRTSRKCGVLLAQSYRCPNGRWVAPHTRDYARGMVSRNSATIVYPALSGVLPKRLPLRSASDVAPACAGFWDRGNVFTQAVPARNSCVGSLRDASREVAPSREYPLLWVGPIRRTHRAASIWH